MPHPSESSRAGEATTSDAWEPCPRCTDPERARRDLACALCGRSSWDEAPGAVPAIIAAAYRLDGLRGVCAVVTGDGTTDGDAFSPFRRRLRAWCIGDSDDVGLALSLWDRRQR